jgi:catechol 2,3-dioxygenase-like lactoylglutathione lyase family enzyme
MPRRGFRPRALGGIALRTCNLAGMVAFYRDGLGLELLRCRVRGRIVFFRLADGFAGHAAVLALFEEAAAEIVGGEGQRRSSLHHLALSLPWAEQAAAEAWFERQGLPYGSRSSPGSAGAACSSTTPTAIRSS